MQLVQLDVVESTQGEVHERLALCPAGTIVAVRAKRQHAGRGRSSRSWQNPAGAALLLSIGVRDAPLSVLTQLPRRVATALQDAITPSEQLCWKEPNDLLCARSGAKVAGVLVDAQTQGNLVREVVIGVGCNLAGQAFETIDGRRATTLEQLGAVLDHDALLAQLAQLLR